MRPHLFESHPKIGPMTTLINWFCVRDYDIAKQDATKRIVMKQARGNIASQSGWSMSEEELSRNSADADFDVAYIEKALERA